MINSYRACSPLRLRLGRGTDVSSYSDRFGGCVLNATIDLFSYCAISPRSDQKVHFTAPDRGESFSGPAEVVLALKGEVGTTPMEWLSEFNSKRWDCDYTNNGIEEIKSFLSKKNTILNASGVVIRNIEGLSEMVDSTMRLCADWLLWIRLLEKGNIAYVAEPLNYLGMQLTNLTTICSA